MIERHLPVVHRADPLRQVLERMRAMNVSGAICIEDKLHWLLYVREVIFALHANPEATVGSVGRGISLDDTSEVRLTGRIRMRTTDSLSETVGERIWRSTEEVLDRRALQAYVVEIHSQSLETALTSSARDCFCDKSGERVTGRKDGEKCPNSAGGTVRCA